MHRRQHTIDHSSRSIRGIALAMAAAVAVGASTAAASAAPTSPSSDGGQSPLFDGEPEVAPGTYVADGFGVPFEITVPAGWTEFGGFALLGPDDTFISFWSPTALPTNACQWRTHPATGVTTAEGFVNALEEQIGTAVGMPREITLGDYSGYQATLAPEPGADIGVCDDGHHVVWSDADGGYRLYSTPTEVGTVWAIDLPGELAVFSAGSFGPILPATQRQVLDVLDSITFVTSDHP